MKHTQPLQNPKDEVLEMSEADVDSEVSGFIYH